MARLIPDPIEVVGANANNLSDVDIDFPRNAISMVVGVSGSGKSSLLAGTLAREGNLRLETFLGVGQAHLDAPQSDAFIGRMPPTVHVGQRAFRASSRTTVATASGLIALLRRMFVRGGVPVSVRANVPVPAPSPDTYRSWLLEHHHGQVVVWAIPLSFVASDGLDMAARLRELEIDIVVVRSETDSAKRWKSGRVVALNKFKALSANTRHLVECEIGRVGLEKKRSKASLARLDSLLTRAFAAGEGRVFIELSGADEPALDSRRHWVHPADPQLYRTASDHLLSFNAPEHEDSGACSKCRGLGRATTVDIDALVVNPERSMHEGAFALWTTKNYKYVNIQHETLEGLRGLHGFDPDRPWEELGADARRLVLEGAGDQLITDSEPGTGRKMSKPRPFLGFRAAILERVAKRGKTGERLAFLVGDGPCPACEGSRWSVCARALNLGGRSIDELLALNFDELAQACSPHSEWSRALGDDARPALEQLRHLAQSLVGVGLDYLCGARGMLEISEGESRRLRLAAALDGRHSGLCLLLDEPARGLHDLDVDRLVVTLAGLRGTHTLILNEHRRRMAAVADFFVELGPGAGPKGGTVVYSGRVPKKWWRANTALERELRPVSARGPKLRIRGARVNNLQGVDVSIPLGHLVCVVGVSGSGKSSFVRGVLVPALAEALESSTGATDFDIRRGRWTSLAGVAKLSGLVALDQRAPPANRRSTVATFLGLAKTLRQHYAKLPAAKAAGLSASDFGLNAGTGRCARCLGIGEFEESGHWIPCPACGGSCFGPAVLAVLDEDLDIAQLLDRSITDLCIDPFAALSASSPLLQTIEDLGVGHLSLSRRLDTISGGELQRLRIARELSDPQREGLLFVLDEPAAGLHRSDVARLLGALDRIVAGGHSVVVVEHNLELVAAADWVIEFGPGSGPRGGQIVAQGAPSTLKGAKTATGRMLEAAPKPVKLPPKKALAQASAAPTPAEAASALRWLRRLLGEDLPPRAHELLHEGASPTVVLAASALEDRRLLEYGGLDRELAMLTLECQRASDLRFDEGAFIETWLTHPTSALRIHPLINELGLWGVNIPKSVIKGRRDQLLEQGLEWFAHSEQAKVRAGGGPLRCPDDADSGTRLRLLEGALLLGAGYVELCRGAEVLAIQLSRAVDIQRGLVGPLSPSAHDFSRRGQRGRCPACRGSGRVRGFDPTLVFGDQQRPIEDKACLHPGAQAVLKGSHRNVLMPFLRRLAKEELWTADRPLVKLEAHERAMLVHGFWSRPGPGSFLKTAKSDPKEVSSWLRWDGLFAHIHENAERGPTQWREQLRASEHAIACTSCGGLGLRPQVALHELGGRSYDDWLAQGDVAELHRALTALETPSPRAERRRDRLLDLLAPISRGKLGATKIGAPLHDGPWATLAPAVAAAFTDMPVIFSDDEP